MAGFVRDRSVYLLTDSAAAVQRAAQNLDQWDDVRAVGWFRSSALEEWRQIRGDLVSFESIDPDTLAVRLGAWKTMVVDVRDRAAFRSVHIPDSIQLPLREVGKALAGLPHQTNLTLVCEEGDVCTFAAGLLWRAGYANLTILRGGFAGYVQHGFRVVRGEG